MSAVGGIECWDKEDLADCMAIGWWERLGNVETVDSKIDLSLLID